MAIKYYMFGGQRVAMKSGSTLTYLHGDHLGSTALATKTDSTVHSSEQYFAYGKPDRLGTGADLPTDNTFTGQKQDGSGLMYYGARFFDPQLGTFVSPDTIVPDAGSVFGYNRTMYSFGNPLKFVDPSGHDPCENGSDQCDDSDNFINNVFTAAGITCECGDNSLLAAYAINDFATKVGGYEQLRKLLNGVTIKNGDFPRGDFGQTPDRDNILLDWNNMGETYGEMSMQIRAIAVHEMGHVTYLEGRTGIPLDGQMYEVMLSSGASGKEEWHASIVTSWVYDGRKINPGSHESTVAQRAWLDQNYASHPQAGVESGSSWSWFKPWTWFGK